VIQTLRQYFEQNRYRYELAPDSKGRAFGVRVVALQLLAVGGLLAERDLGEFPTELFHTFVTDLLSTRKIAVDHLREPSCALSQLIRNRSSPTHHQADRRRDKNP